MATTVDTLLVRIEADMKDIRRDLRRLEQRTKKSTDKMNSSFSKVGKVFKVAMVAVVVRQAAQAAIALTKLASGVEEMQAKSSVVFGAFANDFRAFTTELAQQTGRSRFELESMGATVQDTFVPMGFAREKATELSKELVKLAVDVASFNNKADTEVMEAFQSALVGNHETMRQFGVVITEATIKQELLRMGIEGGTKAASNAEKVQARLNLILAGTADAQGDAIKTADSYANRVREMQAALNDLGVEIGTTLMPLMKLLVMQITSLTNATSDLLKDFGLIADTDQGKLERLQRQIKGLREAIDSGSANPSMLEALGLGDTKTENAMGAVFQFIRKSAQVRGLDAVADFIGLQTTGEFLAENLLKSYEEQELALRKQLELETKINIERTHRETMEAKRRREENLVANLPFLPKTNPRTLGNQKVGTSSVIRVAQQDLSEFGRPLALLRESVGAAIDFTGASVTNARKKLNAELDETINKHLDINKKVIEETVENHEIEMKGLKLKLSTIKEIHKEEVLGHTFETKKNRENRKFEELKQKEGLRLKRDKTGSGFNITQFEINIDDERLRKKAELLVAIEMENESNAKNIEIVKRGLSLIENHNSETKELIKNKEALEELKELGLINDELFIELMEKQKEQFRQLTPMYKIITDGLKQVASTISDTFADAFMKGKLSLDSLANLVKSTVAKMIAHVLKMQVLAPILSAFGMQDSTLKTLGFQASGGTMQPNRPYIVGERGAELFVPSGAGTLLNNMNTQNAMSGTSTIINQSINLSTGVAQTVHAEVLNLLPAIKEQTMIAVSDSKRRGGAFAKVMG